MAGSSAGRSRAVSAAEEACPRCRAGRRPEQDYCVECGLRLPIVVGSVPRLRRGWLRRVGWYPGDWIWVPLATLVVAAAGAAVSIAVTHHRQAGGGTTVVASTPGPTPLGAPVKVAATPATAAAAARPNGQTDWPATDSGWTIVLVSYPAAGDRKAPLEAATRAARAGLPEVGVLDSSRYSSLHPGYYVVFSGIYSAQADAQTALRTARASGFGSAYPREISR
jgi:hypothetical protein